MTLIVYFECDADGCEERTDSGELPVSWAVVVRPSHDPLALAPASRHFCPAHLNSADHLELLRTPRE